MSQTILNFQIISYRSQQFSYRCQCQTRLGIVNTTTFTPEKFIMFHGKSSIKCLSSSTKNKIIYYTFAPTSCIPPKQAISLNRPFIFEYEGSSLKFRSITYFQRLFGLYNLFLLHGLVTELLSPFLNLSRTPQKSPHHSYSEPFPISQNSPRCPQEQYGCEAMSYYGCYPPPRVGIAFCTMKIM